MWVRVTHRDGDHLIGTLDNWAIFAYLEPDEMIKFHIDDIIDFTFVDDEDDQDDQAAITSNPVIPGELLG
jgi:hypothetical protein